ncbi:hypothetical protein ETAA8_59290 [Anatilimnocola aggregata]|uniref:Uncharacterized protein n=1 Tax=Anatilimnocola aggregata TaxID=2528021 RepID=A0A517YKN8_9BACT|nr:hypothetical protein ETAA8_59290 [Anatilimnocola aggregata]
MDLFGQPSSSAADGTYKSLSVPHSPDCYKSLYCNDLRTYWPTRQINEISLFTDISLMVDEISSQWPYGKPTSKFRNRR